MSVEIKFCGLTRAEDIAAAGKLGARYGGMIFAGGPRHVSDARAAELVDSYPASLKRVGVFPAAAASEVAARAARLGLDVIQMHGDPTAQDVRALREHWNGEIWAVVRCDDVADDPEMVQLFRVADAVLLDAGSRGTLGGVGKTFGWAEIAERLHLWRSSQDARARVVVAGGLSPANVAEAIGTLAPQVVDVSSGVEQSAGVKDQSRMQEFTLAVRSAALGDE